ncbi:MAG: hypothetical protein V3V33_16715, partial [Candidatus Lokiarchaeia archaeon]
LLIVLSSIATAITLYLLYALSIMDKYHFGEVLNSNYLMVLGWFQTALPFAIIFLVCTVLLYVLRRVYGTNPDGYFKDEDGPVIKSEIDNEWQSYREWIHKTLLERGISENVISDLIEAEIERQKTIKDKKIKTGRIQVGIGMGSIIFGLISLIYGYYVTFGLIGYTIDAALAFTVYHLPTAAMFLLIGLIEFISGKKKKKFYNLV